MRLFKSGMTFYLLLAALIVAPNSTNAAVKVATALGDQMVLQREKPVAIWGTAEAGEKISVNFDHQTKTTIADKFKPQPTVPNQDRAGDYRALHIKIMKHEKTAMVTASDLGSGVHPINKSGYGRRATRVALGFVYSMKVEIYGPIYKSHEVKADKIHITFDHTGKGLAARHSDKLQGFEIADNDGKWHWADAKIVGRTVIVSHDKIKSPTNVRYGWSRNRPWANLFNKDGLPALTFKAVNNTPKP